jgi:hypothetical protein
VSNVFCPMLPAVRREQRVRYRQFLADRDGVPDVESRTLSRREERLSRFLHPLLESRELDRGLFDAQYARFDASRPTSRQMLLILTLVKVNAAEAFGVNSTYPKALRKARLLDDDLELMLLLEETYHTKILLSSALLYGIEVQAPYTPPAGLRALIAGIEYAPETISRPLTLAAEVLGTVAFLNLLYAAREISSGDPELRDALEERLTDVLIDEIGHISFNRMCLGEPGLARARKLLPWVARGLNGAVPEFKALGLEVSCQGLDALLTSKRLPESVRCAAFIA